MRVAGRSGNAVAHGGDRPAFPALALGASSRKATSARRGPAPGLEGRVNTSRRRPAKPGSAGCRARAWSQPASDGYAGGGPERQRGGSRRWPPRIPRAGAI